MISNQIHLRQDCRQLDAPPRDEEGFRLDGSDRHPDLVEAFAGEKGLRATDEVAEIVAFGRDYFEVDQSVPEARTVSRHIKEVLGPERATRRHLYRLFPRGYDRQACRMAGMRKPREPMLDV